MSPRRRASFGGASATRASNCLLASACLACLTAVSAFAQYPGVITKKSSTAQLRAVAVLEWTGDAGKPKACRIVPITIFDGEKLNDAGIYLARPEPLAISGEVEYQLKDNGKTIGLFDIKNTGQEQGSWVGYGEWKPVPHPEPVFAAKAPDIVDEEGDGKPFLHRKKHADEAPAPGTSGSGTSGSGTTGSGASGSGTDKPKAAPDDPDRPKLHKKDDSASSSAGTGTPGTTNPGKTSPGTTTQDTGGPTLHKGSDSPADKTGNPSDKTADSSSTGTADDPDRPKLKKPKQKPVEDISKSESMPQVTDPDRPRLARGKSNADNLKVVP